MMGIQLSCKSRVGLLADVVTVFSNMKINVHELTSREVKNGYAIIFLMIEATGMEQFELILNRLKRIAGVLEATRSSADKQDKQ